jgi:biuret amidohydrolase
MLTLHRLLAARNRKEAFARVAMRENRCAICHQVDAVRPQSQHILRGFCACRPDRRFGGDGVEAPKAGLAFSAIVRFVREGFCSSAKLATVSLPTPQMETMVTAKTASQPHSVPGADSTIHYIDGPRADAPIPRPGMTLIKGTVALVVTDPQNDFLTSEGVAWGAVGASVTRNNTVENIENLLKAAKDKALPVFISPHYYYAHDHQWRFEGALEALMHQIGMFDREGALDLEGFSGSGADWVERYKPYINDGKTIVASPHKIYGPESNDLVLQLRKAGINQVVLAGMSANLCVESHMRELIEQGFNVAIVADATAAAQFPGFDGYEAAFVNYRMLASDVWSTNEAVLLISAL